MIIDIRGRYPLTLAMLQADGVKRQEVIGIYRFRADSGVVHCLDCWEKLLASVYRGRDDLYEIEIDRDYITPINFKDFDECEYEEAPGKSYSEPYLPCSDCGKWLDADTFGIRADLWQCEGCGADVYAYVLGVETGGKKLCRTCYEKC